MVSFLSEAMSTPSELVCEVIVARIRFWWTPWPSWTSDCSLSRIQGMSREAGLVEDGLRRGAEGGPLGAADELLELGAEVELRVGLDQVVDQAHGQPSGGEAHALLGVREDDVVAPRLAGAARLAAPDLGTGAALQLEGDVLGHVAEPGPFVQPLDEAAGSPRRAGVLAHLGQQRQQPRGEAGDGVGRVGLQWAEVDHHPDGRVVAPVVGAAVDPRLEDLQRSVELLSGSRGLRLRLARGATPRAAWSLAGLLVAARAQRATSGALGGNVIGPSAQRGGSGAACGPPAAWSWVSSRSVEETERRGASSRRLRRSKR